MVTRKDYLGEAVEAARSVMIELVHLLGEYRESLVLIGGWFPELLLPTRDKPHVGSIDVDLALDHRTIHAEGYKTIQELLLSRGYLQGKQPFIFLRKVKTGGREITVQVDLLAGEYQGTGKSRRHQRVQDIQVRKVRGCDLAFIDPVEITVEGELPGGGKDSVKIQVASLVTFLVMKGMALDDRLKEKDAWDIYYSVRNYPGGLDALANELKPHLGHGLVREGLQKIEKHFASASHFGMKRSLPSTTSTKRMQSLTGRQSRSMQKCSTVLSFPWIVSSAFSNRLGKSKMSTRGTLSIFWYFLLPPGQSKKPT